MVVINLDSHPVSEEQIERRRALERKLEEETEELAILQKSLEKTNVLTEKMTTMLTAFDSRLSKLEAFILPIHKSTQKLTKLHSNIDQSLAKIKNYTNVFDMIALNEMTVAKGPSEADFSNYLQAILTLKECLQTLEASKYKSSEKTIQSLKDTLWKGIRQVDDMFVKLLSAASETGPEPSGSMVLSDIPVIPEPKIKELQKLSAALADSLVSIGPISSFIKGYEEVRSACLVRYLAPVNQAAKDQELKNIHQKSVYQKGASLLIPYLGQLLKALELEHDLHTKIIPKHHAIAAFVNTITPAVDAYIDVCDSMLNRVRRNVQRREVNDIYMLIDIWEGVYKLLREHASLIAYSGKKGHDLQLVMTNCGAAILSFFKDIHDEFMNDGEGKKQAILSVDGTVHETTSTTMNTLKRLLEFRETMDLIIAENKGKSGAFPMSSLSEYVSKVVDALLADLDVKAKGYKKPTLTNLFLLNNLHYIIKSIKGTKLVEILGTGVVETIDKSIKKQLDFYRSSWIPIVEHLMDTTKISDQGKIITTLSSKQRETIKEKFKNFNKDFEELYQVQKTYAIPDVELRAQVVKEIKQMLIPMYNRFYDRYTEIEFSKNTDKYIKYDKEQLAATLDHFFDASS